MIVVYEPMQPECGLTSSIPWKGSVATDAMLEQAMNQLFQVREWEQIERLEVTREGLRAIIRLTK